jgi:kynurenine formamidase
VNVLVDLSHPIVDGMAVFPGLPRPVIGATLDHDASRPNYEGKAEFYLGHLSMSGGTGTYLDAPFHRHRGAADLSQLALDGLVGLPGVVLDLVDDGATLAASLDPSEARGAAVLLRTGWATRWGTDAYWLPGPALTGALLEALLAAGPALVGIDRGNIDDVADLARPAHTRLLGAGVPIVENLADLSSLPRRGFRFTAVPPKVVRGSNFPVRAFAEL